MKVIVHINSVKNGSTGHIMNSLAKQARKNGMLAYTSCAGNLYQRRLPTECPEFHLYIGGIFENKLHKTLGTVFGCGGCFSHIGTYFYLKKLDKIKPDIIHVHNLHSNYINLKMLFSYIKRKGISVIWTLHDCWSFTGHCPHFQIAGCKKWEEECYECPQYKEYPEALHDDSVFMYKLKKKYFTSPLNMKLVAPSMWLSNLVKKSFLKNYPISVIYNGIDLKTFRFVKSNFRNQYNLEGKIVILGVSFSWGYKKGLDVFVQLAKKLPDAYKIVLVGITEQIRKELPMQIISIGLTNSIEELVQIYSSADIFINPTREEVFGLVNVEALACGVPVITFDSGGAAESIDDFCGKIVEQNDFDGLLKAIDELTKKKIPRELCRKRAEYFSMERQSREYLKLYE